MMGLIGMAQVLATLAYGIKGLRRGDSTWDWPPFDEDPQQANESQMDRWSLNQAPSWTVPPLAIANQYYDSRSKMTKSMRYRLILAKSSDFNWLMQVRHALRDLRAVAADGRNHWVFFFPSNARWLSPGRLSSRKDNCILQIHRIKAVATSIMTTMCLRKRTEQDRYIIH